jgi:hypothetical protein
MAGNMTLTWVSLAGCNVFHRKSVLHIAKFVLK